MELKLTEKQKRFADYYIETGNGAESARLAGYKGSNHDNIATENLRKLAIKEYIDNHIKTKDKARIASQNEVLEFYSSLMRGELKDIVTSTDNEGNVVENEINPSLRERVKGADALAKRYGLNIEKVQLEGNLSFEERVANMSDEELEMELAKNG